MNIKDHNAFAGKTASVEMPLNFFSNAMAQALEGNVELPVEAANIITATFAAQDNLGQLLHVILGQPIEVPFKEGDKVKLVNGTRISLYRGGQRWGTTCGHVVEIDIVQGRALVEVVVEYMGEGGMEKETTQDWVSFRNLRLQD
jgi:hypothetical protein